MIRNWTIISILPLLLVVGTGLQSAFAKTNKSGASENSPLKQPVSKTKVTSRSTAEIKKLLEFSSDNPFLSLKTKSWTAKDKAVVLDAFAEAVSVAPGLMNYAMTGGRLRVYRVPAHGDRGQVIAFVSLGRMAFSDTFFEIESKSESVLHELVHIADAGSRLSLSKGWIAFAQPIIVEMRLRRIFGHAGYWTEDESPYHSYSCTIGSTGETSLEEALAEFFSNKFCRLKPIADADFRCESD